MKSAVLLLGLLALVSGQTTTVQQCLYQGGAAHLPINTYVVGCSAPPCSFPQLTHAEIEIIFRAPRRILSMRTRAYAYIFGPIGGPYDLGPEEITCNFFSNTYCPLLEGEVAQYKLRMYIETWMAAGTSVTVEFVIRDNADDSTVACIRMPIAITPPIASGLDVNSNNNTLGIVASQ